MAQDVGSGDGNAPGGGRVSSLDLRDPKDMALARTAMKRWPKRWRGLTDEFKDQCLSDLSAASDAARVKLLDSEAALEAAKVLAAVAKTAVAMEAQVQADEHLEEKNDRLDAGMVTDRVAHTRETTANELIDEAIALGAVDLLPVALQPVARKRIEERSSAGGAAANG